MKCWGRRIGSNILLAYVSSSNRTVGIFGMCKTVSAGQLTIYVPFIRVYAALTYLHLQETLLEVKTLTPWQFALTLYSSSLVDIWVG